VGLSTFQLESKREEKTLATTIYSPFTYGCLEAGLPSCVEHRTSKHAHSGSPYGRLPCRIRLRPMLNAGSVRRHSSTRRISEMMEDVSRDMLLHTSSRGIWHEQKLTPRRSLRSTLFTASAWTYMLPTMSCDRLDICAKYGIAERYR
jgi:hypothetical protein